LNTNPSQAIDSVQSSGVSGEFIDLAGERFYAIHNVDRMAPFFVSVISNVDHWLFVSSTGGMTAGRVSPATALFPYVTVDKIHESTTHTGSKTLLRVHTQGVEHDWEPFKSEASRRYSLTRNIYKNILGNKLCFEEINHDLQLSFRYTWATSDSFGFVRQCQISNLSSKSVSADIIDGLQNILPAGTPPFTQTNSSNLVDAYKWSELDEDTGLALFTLYSAITDRAEPCESLKANTVFCLGLTGQKVLISSEQLNDFRMGGSPESEFHKRGIRGAYFISTTLNLGPHAEQGWQFVADVEQSQSQVVDLMQTLSDPATVAAEIDRSIDEGSDGLARIMACGDGFQTTAEESVTVHHYANVLFNVLRGGIVDDQYRVPSRDFARTIKTFNLGVYKRNKKLLESLPEKLAFCELLTIVKNHNDLQLVRLCYDYLPITFGRRHGDPSRPWNEFKIKLKDDAGERLLSYEGNWRDIFQNWEALMFSYPEFIENVIAKFVNASTVDGYNPYRITKDGIDWEVEEPDNPWSYIGYWGDHQIIYLQKLLELSNSFHPARLGELLYEPIYCYANVPYKIDSFAEILKNPKSTVVFDNDLAERIEHRVATIGADGKLILDSDGSVHQVNLLEKLLVSLLAKLGNLVIDGGIWLNTQRPEWNDANNALVGQGLSMVTLYYMRRYVSFLQTLLGDDDKSVELSAEVNLWLTETALALSKVRPALGAQRISADLRYQALVELGEAASHYRETLYKAESFSGRESRPLADIRAMLDDALAAIDHSINSNRREDGLYHAYNLLQLAQQGADTETLYPMLEGQVAALSSGAISGQEAAAVLEALFESAVYRPDQQSFMLYPDRRLPDFLEKNRIAVEQIDAIPLLKTLLEQGDERIIVRDASGCYRFNGELKNAGDLNARLDTLKESFGDEFEAVRVPLQTLYEVVFNHQSFTGRSGGMFGFEGLGCVYWHMVSKLLLAVQENYFDALDRGDDSLTCQRLGKLYYRVRRGLGFNKSPSEYGAFPTDPYSHTPKHSGAQQPGMTGSVKEEVLSRFGELGVRVSNGKVHFQPALLRAREFASATSTLRYLDISGNWQEVSIPSRGLAFTWCQVPIIYELRDAVTPTLTITNDAGETRTQSQLELPADESNELFTRSGRIREITLSLPASLLFDA
jgi:hypothetical protein